MHELSLAQALLDLAVRYAEGRRIAVLRVRVGAVSGVVADSLAFCFDFVSRGTLAEGARLELEEVPLRLRCGRCGAELPAEERAGLQPGEAYALARERGCACGSHDVQIVGGREFQLVEIEVQETEDERSLAGQRGDPSQG